MWSSVTDLVICAVPRVRLWITWPIPAMQKEGGVLCKSVFSHEVNSNLGSLCSFVLVLIFDVPLSIGIFLRLSIHPYINIYLTFFLYIALSLLHLPIQRTRPTRAFTLLPNSALSTAPAFPQGLRPRTLCSAEAKEEKVQCLRALRRLYLCLLRQV